MEPVFWHFLFLGVTTLICYCGISGIERASKAMMPLLFALLIVVLCVKPTGLFGEKVTDKV